MCSRNVLSLKEKWYLQGRKIEIFQTTHNFNPHHVPPKSPPFRENTSYGNQHCILFKDFSLKLKKNSICQTEESSL